MRLGGTDAYPVSKLPHAQRWFDLLESMDEKGSDPDALLTKLATFMRKTPANHGSK